MTTNPDLCPCCQTNRLEAHETRCPECVAELGPACTLRADCSCYCCYLDNIDDEDNASSDDEMCWELESDLGPDESMDGDHDSAMTSAGFGTDEDYGFYGDTDPGWGD